MDTIRNETSDVLKTGVSGVKGWGGLSRAELAILCYLVTVLNAMVSTILSEIEQYGFIYSVLNTFGISAIVWIAFYVSLKLGFSAERREPLKYDKIVFLTIILFCVIPLGPAAWILASLAALYSILTSHRDGALRRSGWLIMAVTVPMFWSKRLFNLFSEFFLSIDAELVSSITGTERISNLVPIPGGSGYLQIAAPCSSMANVSLAILCWVLFTQSAQLRWSPKNLFWCASACSAVVLINVMRISLIGFFPSQFDLLHGPVGSTITSWLTVILVLCVCYWGVGRGRFQIV